MREPILKQVQCLSPSGLHHMAYKEWGDADNPDVVVCVHGVSRVADDFDDLARDLSTDFRVVCPDVVGRGRSGWLRDPQHYQLPQYVSDMVTLLARLDAGSVCWVGTSMGGLIGLGLASLEGSPVRKLVLNDVGPSINGAALARIGAYLGEDVRFGSFDEAAAYIRSISQPFGPHSDAEWRKLAADVLRQDEKGQWKRHYDLRLAQPIKATTPEAAKAGEAFLWASYDRISCPTLLLRGAESDLLTPEVAREMTQRGPHARLVEFPGVGHAPTLMHADQIETVCAFLMESPRSGQ
ncbi:Pimeloyl-ACP methyl ester carboxylesterase [Noviherbaspirillum humi]|uniref:Pimeloyl-ACP methyl ester carboxylesterase n=1 Tax=Noviherbaspirillum humi TaxID=1688639 RepID=A0A239KU89_9BURK|nr:alpha/beta hydrolase [Noviherbaspirillum humi]SNT21635.1 Pimeloyl-ACP methyl ester carboxylesterase [Noviherbaspirillum humi]